MKDRAEHIVIAQGEKPPQGDIDDRAFADALDVREFAKPLVQICVDIC